MKQPLDMIQNHDEINVLEFRNRMGTWPFANWQSTILVRYSVYIAYRDNKVSLVTVLQISPGVHSSESSFQVKR